MDRDDAPPITQALREEILALEAELNRTIKLSSVSADEREALIEHLRRIKVKAGITDS